jgi:hypothetical protein
MAVSLGSYWAGLVYYVSLSILFSGLLVVWVPDALYRIDRNNFGSANMTTEISTEFFRFWSNRFRSRFIGSVIWSSVNVPTPTRDPPQLHATGDPTQSVAPARFEEMG